MKASWRTGRSQKCLVLSDEDCWVKKLERDIPDRETTLRLKDTKQLDRIGHGKRSVCLEIRL